MSEAATFQKEVASKLSSHLNKNLSVALAGQIIKLAKNHNDDGFINACQTFGNFDRDFLQGLKQQIDAAPEDIVSSADGNQTTSKNASHRQLSASAQQKLDAIRAARAAKEMAAAKRVQGADDSKQNQEDRRSFSPGARAGRRNNQWSPRKDVFSESTKKRFERGNTNSDETQFKSFKRGKLDRSRYQSPPARDPNELELNREWYEADDDGVVGDWGSYLTSFETDQLQDKVNKRMSTAQQEKNNDLQQWEQHKLQQSGASKGLFSNVEDDTQEHRQHIFVHSLTPPFLEGERFLSRKVDPVSPFKEPTGHFARLAKTGSLLVHEMRLKKYRKKHTRDAISMSGTVLGDVIGVGTGAQPTEAVQSKIKRSDPTVSTNNDIQKQRRSLPAFAVRDELLNVIRENQVTIVIGETGSGKTTQLTQFLYEDGYTRDGKIVGCTQPRRVAAMSVAQRVAAEMNVKLGAEVGYAIRLEDVTSSKTVVKYLTEGVLVRESLSDNLLEKYSCIIMDEAHERALNTDILLGLFKSMLAKRSDLKLIVASATINADRFSKYFGNAPQFKIPGKTFPVDIIYQLRPPDDYVAAAIQQTLQIHLQPDAGDILVFMTGQEDIEATCAGISERLALVSSSKPLLVLPLYSQMPEDLQSKIFEPAPPGVRKVIVSTNIAETSLTIDGIIFVVDCGLSKMKLFNPRFGIEMLQLAPISQANAQQRSGRAGRTAKGVSYRLFTESECEEEMYVQTVPEILRTNLATTALLLKSIGVNNLLEFPFMDPPTSEALSSSLYELWFHGALDNFGELSPLGKKMSQLPMDPTLAKLLINSVSFGCGEEVVTIIAMLTVPRVFYRPQEKADEADAARERFYVAESDHLTLLQVYNQWISNNMSDKWCASHFLNASILRRAYEVRKQIISISTKTLKSTLKSCHGDWDIVRKCLCSGYFHQAAQAKGLGSFVNMRTGVVSQLHPTSSLYGLGHLPEYVIYHELILTGKEYISVVTAVDPLWLAAYGGVFYSVKERKFAIGADSLADKYDDKSTAFKDKLMADKLIYKAAKSASNDTQRSSSVVRAAPKRAARRRGI